MKFTGDGYILVAALASVTVISWKFDSSTADGWEESSSVDVDAIFVGSILVCNGKVHHHNVDEEHALLILRGSNFPP
jgi:hypothetical protein